MNVWMMSYTEIWRENHLGWCWNLRKMMGFQLPSPQLVSLPDFWTINRMFQQALVQVAERYLGQPVKRAVLGGEWTYGFEILWFIWLYWIPSFFQLDFNFCLQHDVYLLFSTGNLSQLIYFNEFFVKLNAVATNWTCDQSLLCKLRCSFGWWLMYIRFMNLGYPDVCMHNFRHVDGIWRYK